MTTKAIRSETANASLAGRTVALLEAEILFALEGVTPVEQMELIEWLAGDMPEDRHKTEVPSVLERMTSEQQTKLIEWVTARMLENRDTCARLRRTDEVKEFNVRDWVESAS